MKKKNLKNLLLHKCNISNLALLHKKVGGALPPIDTTDVGSYYDTNNVSFDGTQCSAIDYSGAPDCPSWDEHTCHTNGATTKAKPPSEHLGCNVGNNQSVMQNVG